MPSRLVVCASGLTSVMLVYASAHGAARATLGQDAKEPRTIEVVARRFAFEPATIEAIAGEPVRLVITSADGVHGLEIKQFDVKREIPRGKTPVTVEFTPTEAGRFPILCSEYCGDGHEDMRGVLIVHAR